MSIVKRDVLNTNVSKHISLQASSDMIPIIQPLEIIGIQHYSFTRRYSDNSYFILTSTPDFSEIFIKDKFYKDSFCGPFDNYKDINMLDTQLGQCKATIAFAQLTHMGNLFIMLRKHENYIDTFYFASHVSNEKVRDIYISHQDSLEKFNHYFLEQAKPIIEQCEQDRLFISEEMGDSTNLGTSNFETILNFNAELLNSKKNNITLNQTLSPREIEVLKCLSMGKTCAEVALILGITQRTIKAHIKSIKDKLSVYTLFQLGKRFEKLITGKS